MKLERFTRTKKQKRIIIGSIVGILLILGGIKLYKTFAFYEEKKEFNVLQGRIPEFKEGDIQLAILVDNERVESIPEKGNYLVDVSCDKGAIGSWDYDNWNISVSNFVTKTKCDVKFTSVSESEMPPLSDIRIKKVVKSVDNISLTTGNSSTRTISFDFSEIPGYESLTVDNFIAFFNGRAYVTNHSGDFRCSASVTNYNEKTGIVTVQYNLGIFSGNLYPNRTVLPLYCVLFYI